MNRWFSFVLVWLAFACAPARTIEFPEDVWIDARFTLHEQCLATEALARWSDATGMTIRPHIGTKGWDNSIVRGAKSQRDRYGVGDEALGYCREIPGGAMLIFTQDLHDYIDTWDLPPDFYSKAFLVIALHEYGHHVGLEHSKGGVMQSKVWREPCLAQQDVDAFCALYGCSRIVPTCKPLPDSCAGL